MTELEQRIAAIRAGERIRGDVAVFRDASGANAFSAEAKALFADELERGPEDEREAVVNAVATIGRMNDPKYRLGALLLRDPDAIALLANHSLLRPGVARDAAIDALMHVPVALLEPHAQAIVEDLAANPDSSALFLVAKTKPAKAKPILDDLVRLGRGGEREMRIALAAMGDAVIEAELVKAFLDTQDPKEKARTASVLGHVGTQRALAALASEMRTPLIDEMPMVMLRSTRIDIVAALSFAFPEEPLLYDNAVTSDADYANIEKFCEDTFGTRWFTPRPPYLWIQGFPGH